MLVLDNQAFWGREEIRLPYKSLGGRPPESPVITCSSNPVNYASLTELKICKLSSSMQTRQNIKQLFGPEKLSELSRSGPLVVKSPRPPTARTSSEWK